MRLPFSRASQKPECFKKDSAALFFVALEVPKLVSTDSDSEL